MMLLCLVSLNDAPPVVWPADDVSQATGMLGGAVRLATLNDDVTRLAVDLVEDGPNGWEPWRSPDGRAIGGLLGDWLRSEDRALWLAYRRKSGAIVQYEALA